MSAFLFFHKLISLFLRTKFFLFFLITCCSHEQGQAVDSEHLSEFTEEESDTPVGTQVRGFLRLDLLYLRPFLIRRVTHQEVSSSVFMFLKMELFYSISSRLHEWSNFHILILMLSTGEITCLWPKETVLPVNQCPAIWFRGRGTIFGNLREKRYKWKCLEKCKKIVDHKMTFIERSINTTYQ